VFFGNPLTLVRQDCDVVGQLAWTWQPKTVKTGGVIAVNRREATGNTKDPAVQVGGGTSMFRESRNVEMKQVTSLRQEQFAMGPIITHSSCATCLGKFWFLKRLRIMDRSPEGWRE
jgi:hypothetical protein